MVGRSWSRGSNPEVLTAAHHELRTPLTSIRSFAEILLRYPVEDRQTQRQFLRIIHEEAERLTLAVERVLGAPEEERPALAATSGEAAR